MNWFNVIVKRTGKEYLSYSSLKYALQDMALFELYMQGRLRKESEALTFGSAYDCLLFTPDEFDKKFFVFDDSEVVLRIDSKNPRATTEYKTWKEEELKNAKGKTHLSADDYQTAIDMITRLDESGILNIYLQGEYQVEFLQNLQVGNDTIPVRGFLDVLGDGFITDSKSTRSINGFRKDVRYMDYDVQAYLYTLAFGIKDFYWVAQEKAYPYLPAAYKASEDTLASGKNKVEKAVYAIKSYCESDKPASKFYVQGEI